MPKFVQNLFKTSFAIISTGICCHLLAVLLFLSTFCCDSEERSYQTEVETRANEHVTIDTVTEIKYLFCKIIIFIPPAV